MNITRSERKTAEKLLFLAKRREERKIKSGNYGYVDQEIGGIKCKVLKKKV